MRRVCTVFANGDSCQDIEILFAVEAVLTVFGSVAHLADSGITAIVVVVTTTTDPDHHGVLCTNRPNVS